MGATYNEFRELYDSQIRKNIEIRQEKMERADSSDVSGYTPKPNRGDYCPTCLRRYPVGANTCPSCDPDVELITFSDAESMADALALFDKIFAEGNSIDDNVTEGDTYVHLTDDEESSASKAAPGKPLISSFHKRRMYPWRFN